MFQNLKHVMLVSDRPSQFILMAYISNNQYLLSNAKQIEPKG